MKYIDSDKLIAEIERLMNSETRGVALKSCVYKKVISLIASLQQEQPAPTCKSCGFYENNCPFIRGKLIPYPNKVCKDYTYSVMKEQEQPEVELELEKEIIRYQREDMDRDTTVRDVAHHFYKLGLNAKKDREYDKGRIS